MKEHFNAGLNSLIISIKAGSKDSYKKWTGKDVYSDIFQSITNLFDYRGGATITIAANIENETTAIINSLVHAKVKFINLHFCSPAIIDGKPNSEHMMSPGKAAKIMVKTVRYIEKKKIPYNVQISLPFCLFEPEFIFKLLKQRCLTSGCIVMKKSGIIIGDKGEVGFCNHMMDFPFGKYGENFITGDELINLYYSQNEFWETTNRAPSEKCIECPINWLCCGGCPLKWTCYSPEDYVIGGEKFVEWNDKFRSIVSNNQIFYI